MDGHDQVQTIGTRGRNDTTSSTLRARRRRGAVRRRVRSRGPGGVLGRIVSGVGAFALAAGTLVSVPLLTAAPAHAATTNDMTLEVVSAADGTTAVPGYRYMINEDNSGKAAPYDGPAPGSGCSAADASYPTSCDWPSINQVPGAAPIVWQGTAADFAGGQSLTLADGDYLVSVLADGYKIDGAHFSMPIEAPGTVTVEMNPDPLPDSTLRAQVFLDDASTNGAIDANEPGLAGFQGHVNDTLGEITTDVYGNPLCTKYEGETADYTIPASALDAEGLPVPIPGTGGKCLSDATGMIVIPHLGTNRYTTYVIPPDGSGYLQTTTLEGNHDFDTWLMEGATGYDTEFTVAGEPVPTPQFGFVKPQNDLTDTAVTGSITGTVVSVKQYYPPIGGSFNYFLGQTGSKLDKPIPDPILSLNDLGNGDQSVWIGRGDANGHFTIPNVPDGTYQLTWWDEPQNYILQLVQVTVSGGQPVDLEQLPLNGWWTQLSGHVFYDDNANGKWDFVDANHNGHWDQGEGEQPVKDFPLTLRKPDNSLMDRGSNAVTTDFDGYYTFESAYPLSEWTVMEAYADSLYTTGITYQADNQPDPTTVLGAGVDVSTLNIIGLSGRLDWGVAKYNGTNGGIVGSVSYDTTRNELDPTLAASEDWQPGVPNVPVRLYATVDCPTNHADVVPPIPCDPLERYVLGTDGSVKKGDLLNSYLSEHWSRPTGCTARDVDGNPLTHPGQENVLVPTQDATGECLAALVQGVQFGPYDTDQGTPDANFGAAVDGNYGFGDACTGTLDDSDPENPVCNGGTFEPLVPGGYLVSIDIPDMQVPDPADPSQTVSRPMYQVTQEEDINVARGDTVVPQVPPPSCAGKLHIVDVANDGTSDNYGAIIGNDANGVPTGVTVPASTPVENQPFVDMGGSPFEGTPKPMCDTKLVDLSNNKSIVPMFNIFTDVPIPSRLRGLVVDDLNFSVDKRTVLYGDKAGVPNAPVGIYDYKNRLVYTAESDFNGFYDVLLPSTDHISCPTPSGVCANVYRFVGNDPGIPGRLNQNYNPRFRTIATEFEALPGVTIPTDLAPTQVGVSLGVPGTSPITVSCPVNEVQPQLFRVSKPFKNTGDADRSLSITGFGFGDSKGTGTVRLGSTVLATTSWSNTQIVATVPSTGLATGSYQLTVTADNGKKTVNGLTFHITGGTGNNAYPRNLYEVGPDVDNARYNPTATTHAIQNALDDAASSNGSDLVVVYPNTPTTTTNPRGAYYENLVVSAPVKLQGVGPGGFQGSNNTSPYVQGTILDGSAFGGDTQLATDWFTKVGAMTWVGNQTVSDGAVVYLLAPTDQTFGPTASFTPAVDGFDIRGGDQQGFPGNINDLTGQPTGLPPNIVTQGGAVFANAYVRQLQVTNNVVENNGGGYGTIRIGTPDLPAPDTNQHNEKVRIANNRIVQNAGTNLAGAIGLFAGSDGYEVSGNDICGNFSLEYGAGVSVYGYSPGGKVHDNRISLNNSNDEGAGIMIAGQLPANPDDLSPGSGAVDIYANQIQGNLANDDGGGIRFLQAGNFPMNVYNNVVAGNVSTHEGGGISLNDAPNVRIYSNTIMDNLTTATAVTSNGLPAPAGISTSANSVQLQATLPGGAPTYSNPLVFDNILWNNRAGTRAGTTVTGIGLEGDTTAPDYWDVGNADATGNVTVSYSIIQQSNADHAFTSGGGNAASDPSVKVPWVPSVDFATWRQNPAFVDATLVAPPSAAGVPPDLLGNLGDYHLTACPGSPACDNATNAVNGVNAPATDIDGDARPATGKDIGSDEVPAGTTPPPTGPSFLFSTAGSQNPPGVNEANDQADVYSRTSSGYARTVDMSTLGVPVGAEVDGFSQVSATSFYLSFASDVTLPIGGAPTPVADEDVVLYNGSTWSMFFDGSQYGMTANSLDVDAAGVQNGVLYFSTFGAKNPPGVSGTADDADVYSFSGGTFTRVFDASAHGVPSKARVDGAVRLGADHFLLSFSSNTSVPNVGSVQDEDIVEYQNGTWSVWFDGTANGLTTNNLDIDAFSLPNGATP